MKSGKHNSAKNLDDLPENPYILLTPGPISATLISLDQPLSSFQAVELDLGWNRVLGSLRGMCIFLSPLRMQLAVHLCLAPMPRTFLQRFTHLLSRKPLSCVSPDSGFS
jgi:hypothetical protein